MTDIAFSEGLLFCHSDDEGDESSERRCTPQSTFFQTVQRQCDALLVSRETVRARLLRHNLHTLSSESDAVSVGVKTYPVIVSYNSLLRRDSLSPSLLVRVRP